MSLSPGQRLGPYEVVASLGAGGMGEVYRATDTKLGREVAVKLLPPAFASDPDRLARFEREAKLLASLNHTAIAHLYGLEEASGQPFLVLELAEGEDLSVRIARGRLPLDEAIAIAKQIAEALEAAHEKGIVHRDLKPANVKVAADGQVKVLDFGLAKAWAGDTAGVASGSSALSQSPTLAHGGTEAGLLLGTAAYMAPEQARGKPVDKRADVWAFGAVLFEMLAGRKLFEGETITDILAAVVRQDIDWSALPASTPAGIRRLLHRCLERDPKLRLRDIGEARIALGAPDEPATATRSAPGRPLPSHGGRPHHRSRRGSARPRLRARPPLPFRAGPGRGGRLALDHPDHVVGQRHRGRPLPGRPLRLLRGVRAGGAEPLAATARQRPDAAPDTEPARRLLGAHVHPRRQLDRLRPAGPGGLRRRLLLHRHARGHAAAAPGRGGQRADLLAGRQAHGVGPGPPPEPGGERADGGGLRRDRCSSPRGREAARAGGADLLHRPGLVAGRPPHRLHHGAPRQRVRRERREGDRRVGRGRRHRDAGRPGLALRRPGRVAARFARPAGRGGHGRRAERSGLARAAPAGRAATPDQRPARVPHPQPGRRRRFLRHRRRGHHGERLARVPRRQGPAPTPDELPARRDPRRGVRARRARRLHVGRGRRAGAVDHQRRRREPQPPGGRRRRDPRARGHALRAGLLRGAHPLGGRDPAALARGGSSPSRRERPSSTRTSPSHPTSGSWSTARCARARAAC